MKKFIPVILTLVILMLMCGCSSENREQTTVESQSSEEVTETTDSYSDEGRFFCMGKRDTCQKKTNDAEDFFCNSCDPDGDNKEG